MEHQDTMLTSMRPRLKELNDNPYIFMGVVKVHPNLSSLPKGIPLKLDGGRPHTPQARRRQNH